MYTLTEPPDRSVSDKRASNRLQLRFSGTSEGQDHRDQQSGGPEEDWDFRGCDTQYSTHGMHTYVAAMIPQLACKLVDRYAPPGDTVLDPFCGGGSVLVESVRSGRPAVGRDVNELAVLISQAKTTPIDSVQASEVADSIIRSIDPLPSTPEVDANMSFWFKHEHLAPLHALHESISEQVDKESALLPFFLTVFSATVRDVSLTYRNEVRLRRMTSSEIENFNVDPIDRFRKRVVQASGTAAGLPSTAKTDIGVGNVQSLSLRDGECSTVVCSPPYGDERNGVSYTQFSKNMLRWLGHSHEQIRRSKEMTLGWGKRERSLPHSATLHRALEAIDQFPNSVREAISFYADYQDALAEMARVTRGHIVIVIGQRVLRDTIIDNGAITSELMENIGVSVIDMFYRKLPSKRLPKMRQFGAAIDCETILVFHK